MLRCTKLILEFIIIICLKRKGETKMSRRMSNEEGAEVTSGSGKGIKGPTGRRGTRDSFESSIEPRASSW